MSTYAYTYAPGLIDAGQLATFIREMALPYAYAESEADIVLTTMDELLNGVQLLFRPANPRGSNPVIPFEGWTHGRAFGRDAELRWDKDGTRYCLLLLTEGGVSPAWTPLREDFDREWQDRRVMLLGTRTADLDAGHALRSADVTARIETRYPRPLVYPVGDDVAQVYVRCRDYSVCSVVVLTRLMSVGG